MLILAGGAKQVAAELNGRRLLCPCCGGVLQPWGYGRDRVVRRFGAYERVRPRRSRCGACRRTHVLLPDRTLLRRLDHVDVIGSALVETATGAGYRKLARRLKVPPSTVRRWISRFVGRAPRLLTLAPANSAVDPSTLERRLLIRTAIEALSHSCHSHRGTEPSWQQISVSTVSMARWRSPLVARKSPHLA